MATIISSSNQLEQKLHQLQSEIGCSIRNLILTFWLIIPIFIIIPKITRLRNEFSRLRQGLKGEKNTLKALNALSDEYFILGDLRITSGNKASQLDTIVVGPTGIFIVEVKNLIGKITGSCDDRNLTQIKKDRYNIEHTATLYNPIKQVGTHTFVLSSLLKQHKLNTYIQPIVYFSSLEAKVKIHSSKVPIFEARKGGTRELLHYISSYNSNLNKTSIDAIVDLLKNFQNY